MYRLICKETVEEKILQRASQKNTVQQLVMTGGHVQGDLLAPEDVVSLLIDDAQLEQKMKEVSQQVFPFFRTHCILLDTRGKGLNRLWVSGTEQAKDRQKKKSGTKGIRVDADGLASFEDFENAELRDNDYEPPDVEKTKSSGKKVIIFPLVNLVRYL